MAPVGSFESLSAAIKAGCDSVYFGIEQLNMRSRSSINFTMEDLEAIAETCNLSYTHAPNPLVVETLIINLADRFEQFNPRFNRSKFLAVALA